MNHSCNPTVSLDTDTMTVVAVVDLKEGMSLFASLPCTCFIQPSLHRSNILGHSTPCDQLYHGQTTTLVLISFVFCLLSFLTFRRQSDLLLPFERVGDGPTIHLLVRCGQVCQVDPGRQVLNQGDHEPVLYHLTHPAVDQRARRLDQSQRKCVVVATQRFF